MTDKIKCQSAAEEARAVHKIRIKVIKAPLVETRQLRQVITARARALVLENL